MSCVGRTESVVRTGGISLIRFEVAVAWKKADEVWTQLAEEVGGEFVCVDAFGGNPFFKIKTKLRHWTVFLDSRGYGRDLSMGTRIRTAFQSRDALHLSMKRTGLLDHLGMLVGLGAVRIGDPFYDEHFIVHASNEAQVRKLLCRESVRSAIEAAPWGHLEIRDQDEESPSLLPEGVDELIYRHACFLTDLSELRRVFDLISEFLEQLVRIGSILEIDCNVDY